MKDQPVYVSEEVLRNWKLSDESATTPGEGKPSEVPDEDDREEEEEDEDEFDDDDDDEEDTE